MKTTQMQSCVHENGTVECALVEITVPDPEPDQVVEHMEGGWGYCRGPRLWTEPVQVEHMEAG